MLSCFLPKEVSLVRQYILIVPVSPCRLCEFINMAEARGFGHYQGFKRFIIILCHWELHIYNIVKVCDGSLIHVWKSFKRFITILCHWELHIYNIVKLCDGSLIHVSNMHLPSEVLVDLGCHERCLCSVCQWGHLQWIWGVYLQIEFIQILVCWVHNHAQ